MPDGPNDLETELEATKMRRLLITMIAVGGLVILTSAQAAVKNVAWLQGTSLKNGSSVLNSTEPMGIKWAAHSSIDPTAFKHSLVAFGEALQNSTTNALERINTQNSEYTKNS